MRGGGFWCAGERHVVLGAHAAFPWDSCKLFNRVAFQEHRLLQGAEEPLVGQGIFDGAKIGLSAGSHDELRVVAVADGDGHSHEVAAVVEGAPISMVSGEEQERVRLVAEVGWVGEGRSLKSKVFLGGHDSGRERFIGATSCFVHQPLARYGGPAQSKI